MIQPEDNILDYVDDYVHGALSPKDAKIVERYCETTRVGKVALEEARRRFEAMKMVPPSEASEQLIQDALAGIAAKQARRRRFRRIYGRTATCAVVLAASIIAAVNLYYYWMTPSSYDVRLLGQNELLADSGASLRVAVFDHPSGKAVAGVPVEVALVDPSADREVELATFTTDDRGAASPRLEIPDWADGRYELRVRAWPGGSDEVLRRPIQLKREWRLMLSTDKPVYQPGQTIHLRSLALKKPDLKPVTAQQVTFSITDPKGNVIFRATELTSKYGIASANCPLATEILEGEYTVECRTGESTSERSVTVEKYVLPKFKVGLSLDKPFYAPGDEVSGTLQADYFFGKPVVDGEVQIDVRAADVASHQIASLTERTDKQGEAEFRFPLPDQLVGREQDAGDARFMLVATLTDTAGQTHSKGTSRIVTANPIRVEVIPESGTLVQGLANTIYVFTSYPDGRPAQTRLVVHGIPEEIETGPLGVASFEITPEDDWARLTLRATDGQGRMGRKHVELACGSYDGDFLIRPDKAVYTGGDTMTLVALGGGLEPVFVDFVKDGQTMLTAMIEMKDGRGQHAVDLPPELFGTVEVCAYRFRAHGLAARKSRMIYVGQARELAIHATLDQEEYRPGTKATLKLRLTDPEGEPMPGAISLQAVGEAVFAVLGQQTGIEKTFFLLEQELLEPVYMIYPG
ncbi:MAG: MG2 domain-containing protein, partial [Planctomycetota bacterium]